MKFKRVSDGEDAEAFECDIVGFNENTGEYFLGAFDYDDVAYFVDQDGEEQEITHYLKLKNPSE
jgi:hypothetical protein